jgi:hypothetical protein
MNKHIKNLLIIIATIIGMMVIYSIPKANTDYYWLEIDEINDSIAIVILTDVNGEPVAIIDDNIYRHGDEESILALMTVFETSIGFESQLKASERYYEIVTNPKKYEKDSDIPIIHRNNNDDVL